MKYLITGAGQIGSQLAHDLVSQGHEVVTLRRSNRPRGGEDVVVGDAGDPATTAKAAEGAAAIFHCIHAAYDADAWRRELPSRERNVMDVAAARGIPVVFPESMYAFGHATENLTEGQPTQPCSPLGLIRKQLLNERAKHRATTISVVASDLIGPTAGSGSVAATTILGPVTRGRRAFVLADPWLPHSWTFIPDLTRAMLHAANQASTLAPTGNAVLHAPTSIPATITTLATTAADLSGQHQARITRIPPSWLHAVRTLHPMLRSLDEQSYLWRHPVNLRPGILTQSGLQPTPLVEAIEQSLASTTTTIHTPH